MKQRLKIYNPNRSLNPQASPLASPSGIPGFGELGVGARPATATSPQLNGFADWTTDIGTALLNLLPQAVTAAASSLTSAAEVKAARAEADRLRAETESTKALSLLEAAKNNPMTTGIIAVVAVAGVLGYFMLSKKRRNRKGQSQS